MILIAGISADGPPLRPGSWKGCSMIWWLGKSGSAEAFSTLCATIEKQGLSRCGQTTRQHMMDILAGYWAARRQIFELEKAYAGNAGALALLAELRDMLHALVPENFILLYDDQRSGHLLRYIKALAVRAQRGVVNLEKDQAKARQLEPFVRQLTRWVGDLDTRSSDEKKAALEVFYWMVEEYKISLFAQEIGTDRPISAKRLQQQLDLIERLA